MKRTLAVLVLVGMAGCSPFPSTESVFGATHPYSVEKSTDRFSTFHTTVISTTKNRLSYSASDFIGSTTTILETVLDPFVYVNEDGKPYSYGFRFFSLSPGPYWIHIVKGNEAVFLVDGERIALRAMSDGRIDSYVDSSTLTTFYMDSGTFHASLEQMRKISAGQSVEIKITGRLGSVEFIRYQGRAMYAPSFLPNVRKFVAEEIDTRL